MRVHRLLAQAAALALLATPALAHPQSIEKLGEVRFDTSCNTEAQTKFNRGVALLHSFWYAAAKDAFNDVLRSDPGCAITYWGIAVASLNNPIAGIASATELEEGLAAVDKAKTIGARTQRERDYVEAIAAYYQDYKNRPHAVRAASYEKAMETVAATYPDDQEASIYYALALNMTISLADKTYANQLKAAALLEKVFAAQPDHPGAAHYLIHSYDFPPIAEKGLPAARRYAAIAPAAPHALHMPAHIFTRLGYWQDSIDSNVASADVARKELAATKPGVTAVNELHALDYLAYAYLQLGQDAKAGALIDHIAAVDKPEAPNLPVGYALAAIPARYALERGDWQAAADLTPHAAFPWDRVPHAEAITHFARGIGAAKLGDVAAAHDSADRLDALHTQLRGMQQGYWAEQVAIQQQVVLALVAYTEGKKDEALAILRSAADRESASEKHIVTPGPLLPARELLGAMLLDMGRPAEALAEFEASQTTEPNRLAGLAYAAKAATLAEQKDKAREYSERVAGLLANADGAAASGAPGQGIQRPALK
jgi:tetratricopeptide (TPR) repeat protein